ncbi:MAG: hypothetical protein ACI9ES_000661 [Oceanospirillaceae bacterium]|jgi:hypothetical protein
MRKAKQINNAHSSTVSAPLVKRRNIVAKFAKTFNKAQCHLDRKAAQKRGHIKHRNKGVDLNSLSGYLNQSLLNKLFFN